MIQSLSKKSIKKFLFILVAINTFFSIAESVKVGYFPLEDFNKLTEKQIPYGYNVDYLNKISEYTGWTYDYIIYDSWVEAFQGLSNNEIDMLAPAQYTDSRGEDFLFSGIPIGREYGSVLTLETNKNLIYEDFQKFNEITFGCVNSFIFKERFFLYAKQNGFTPKVKYYKDTNALISALNIGEVDAIIANLMTMHKNMKILARIGTSQYYYMFTKNNYEKQVKMDDALSKIQIDYPFFQNQLENKYMKSYQIMPYTKSELDFISKIPTLSIGCITNRDPISYQDKKTGEIKGITRDILDSLSKNTGLTFTYVPLPVRDVSYDYLRNNKISLVSSVEYNNPNIHSSGLKLSSPYLQTQKIIIQKKGNTFNKDEKKVLGISSGSETFSLVLKEKYPNFSISFFDSTEKGLDAVKDGKIDYFIQNQYVVDRILLKPKYNNLEIVSKEGFEDILCLSPILNRNKSEQDPILSDPKFISIINKGLARITPDETDRIIISNTSERMYKYSIKDYLFEFRIVIFLIFVIIATIIFALIIVEKLHKKNIDIIIKNERKLKNITNNINGGVVLLLPDQGLKIQYANKGFFKLLQYNKEEFDKLFQQDYIAVVHPDDISQLNNVIELTTNDYSQISIELRIRRRDGKYINTLFNGTISKEENNLKKMYCVITDISAQKIMLDQLEIQQERYEVIINRSQDIIFDIDLLTSKTNVSTKFQEQFGWKLPEIFVAPEAPSLWHIYSEDSELFKNKIQKLIEQNDTKSIDEDFNARILTSTYIPIWCNISIHQIKKEGKAVRLIGRINNIDNEMKEKEKIIEKASKDSLTGLYRKETFFKLIKKDLKEEQNLSGALIFLDLDNFKSINDKLGHIVGDRAIVDASKKLQIIFSNYDIIGRFGGDEFCIFVKNIPIDTLKSKLEWTLEKLEETYSNDTVSVKTSASIGISLIPEHGTTFELLLDCADKALYDAKNNGRNQYSIYSTKLSKIKEK